MKTFTIKPIIVSLFSLLMLAPVSCPADVGSPLQLAPYKAAVRWGAIQDPRIEEVSGISVSRQPGQTLWMVNDSGNPPVLYRVSIEGRLLGQSPIQGADNLDWEDLSGFSRQGQSYLVIADVGDNWALRDHCRLLFLKEPEPSNSGKPVPLLGQMRFRYENGARDCEAVAVDAANNRILLLSKREKQPMLYELPLVLPTQDNNDENREYTARQIATVATIPPPTAADLKEKYGKGRSRPTAMDISADGNTLVILTYKHAYLFRRPEAGDWNEAFLSPPELIPLPLPETGELVQREALCLDRETGQIFVTTEQLPAPIYLLDPLK